MAINIPYTFVTGTTADPTQVNANFSEIESKAPDKTGTETITGAWTFNGSLSISSLAISSVANNALDVAGGITAGTGNVGIIDTSGRIPAISSTYFASLSGANLTALNASNLASGTVPTARLGSGTANSTTFLRGDGTWTTVGVRSIQAGTIALNNGSSSATATITSVTTSKAFVLLNGWTTTGAQTLDEVKDVGFRVELTNSTTVTAYTGQSTHSDITIGYTVVEFY